MTDVLLEFSQNPIARSLMSRTRLPIPLPEKLDRMQGPTPERVLEDRRVLCAGMGALAEPLARTLARAGALPLLDEERLLPAFAGPGEAYGRHAKLLTSAPSEAPPL